MASINLRDNDDDSAAVMHDEQGRRREILPSTQAFTTVPQPMELETGNKVVETKKKKKKKCRGNRKLQHFKRKCRSRGLDKEAIAALIDNRVRTSSNDDDDDNRMVCDDMEHANKRKRETLNDGDAIESSIQSLSQLSITAGKSKKKVKTTQAETTSECDHMTFLERVHSKLYKLSKYLKMPRRLLVHSLQLQLNYPLKKNKKKKKEEQNFVLERLKWIDRRFCLEQFQHLYRIYFDLGSKERIWPVSSTTTTTTTVYFIRVIIVYSLA
jgi:hypothetical protein